jgi:hypothetical protein
MQAQEELGQWLAIRKEEGLKIDPETAEVEWWYANVGDPYDVGLVPKEDWCIGRASFARSPKRDIWVSFHDLPEATEKALWEKHRSKLAFPAGLFDDPSAGNLRQALDRNRDLSAAERLDPIDIWVETLRQDFTHKYGSDAERLGPVLDSWAESLRQERTRKREGLPAGPLRFFLNTLDEDGC